MIICLIQYEPVWQNIKESQKKILELLSGRKEKADIYVFPEMTLTGFTMDADTYGESMREGETVLFFRQLSKKLNSDIIFGMIEKEEAKSYNTLVHIKDGALYKTYRKIHPFSYSKEDQYYSRGDAVSVTDYDNVSVGLSICYDLRFPELYRLYGKERAQVIINIANWPVKRIEHWKALLRARAIENQCFMAGVNRTGEDPKEKYNGQSAVYAPNGDELVLADDKEAPIYVDLDINLVETQRSKYPFLNDIQLI